MGADLLHLVEQAEARKAEAFKIVQFLLQREDVKTLLVAGLKKYFGQDNKKIEIEMNDLSAFADGQNSISVFRTVRGVSYMLWGVVIEQMKMDPTLTRKSFEDNSFVERYLGTLSQDIYQTYSSSGASSTY